MGKYKNSNNRICKETIKLQENSPKNEWWDEECSQTIKQYKIAKMKSLQQKTRANQEAKKVCKQKKGLWFNNKIMQIVEAYKRIETKTFLEEVKYFNQQHSTLPTYCKVSENNVVSQIEQVLNTCKYYTDLGLSPVVSQE